MATIRAPFNFVPLSKEPYIPKWANEISQDVPFSDGMSGVIELKITAESPIFVRNGHTQKDADEKNEIYESFSKTDDGRYFIPATSIKGAIRNVLEIMSCGKMDKVQNESFGIRDLSNGVDGTFYRDKIKTEKIHCGWLRMHEDNYYLDDCGLPWRISEEEIDNQYGCGLDNFVKTNEFKKDYCRTAKAKYDLFGDNDLTNYFQPNVDLRDCLKVGNRLFVRFCDSRDGERGTIVFTGQPGTRKTGTKTNKKGEKSWTNKYFEFVIPEKVVKKDILIDEFTIKEFLSIHKNSPDYVNFRKDQLSNGETIPVFFLYDEADDTVDSIGLSYMYKYPAFNSIYNGIPQSFLAKEKHDLADCIFGYTSPDQSLRGRVQFSNAFVEGTAKECPKVAFALSTPNPSYYPLYLGNGQTWNSDKIKIAGRKRYPTRNDIRTNAATDAMTSCARPLDKGTIFAGRIAFHNLRPIELGALLSAITFHRENGCYHNIGQGKPLGYGKIKIDAEIKKCTSNCSDTDLLNSFENEMNTFVDNWKSQQFIVELFAMAKGIPAQMEDRFTYMHMSKKREENEFLIGRDQYSRGNQLGTFTQIINDNVPKCAFIGNVQSGVQRINEEKLLEEKHKKELELKKLIEESRMLLEQDLYAEALNKIKEAESTSFGNLAEIKSIKDEIENKIHERKDAFNETKRQAEELFGNKEYDKAKDMYIQASQYGIEDLSYKIKECDDIIKKLSYIANSSIDDFLLTIKLASIEAFAGSLKKRNDITAISNEDCEHIANFLNVEIPKLKKDKQKNWKNEKKWMSIVKSIGEEKSQTIFNLINK